MTAVSTVFPYTGLLRFLLSAQNQIMSHSNLCFTLKMPDCCLNLLFLPCGCMLPPEHQLNPGRIGLNREDHFERLAQLAAHNLNLTRGVVPACLCVLKKNPSQPVVLPELGTHKLWPPVSPDDAGHRWGVFRVVTGKTIYYWALCPRFAETPLWSSENFIWGGEGVVGPAKSGVKGGFWKRGSHDRAFLKGQ